MHSQGVRVNQSESSKQYSDQSEGLIPAPNMVSPGARVSELESLQINFVEKNVLWNQTGLRNSGCLVTWSGAGSVRDSQECFLATNKKPGLASN